MSDHRPVLKPEYDKQELPDARKHQKIQFALMCFLAGMLSAFLLISLTRPC